MKIQGKISKGSTFFKTFKQMNKNLGCYVFFWAKKVIASKILQYININIWYVIISNL
jgi:hypothetical protein